MSNPYQAPETFPAEVTRHSDSFTLARPGLKPEHYVPFRLRAVDTFSTIAPAPMLIISFASISYVRSWIFALQLDFMSVPTILRWAGGVLYVLIVSILLWRLLMMLLRGVFRATDVLSDEESRFFPLAATWEPTPWPDCWQKPIPD